MGTPHPEYCTLHLSQACVADDHDQCRGLFRCGNCGSTCVCDCHSKPRVRPLLVQWYRCGRAQRDRGWIKCPSPMACDTHGCQKAGQR